MESLLAATPVGVAAGTVGIDGTGQIAGNLGPSRHSRGSIGRLVFGVPHSSPLPDSSMLLDGVFAATPLDRDSVCQSRLNVAHRLRTNPLPWTGQFSPQFVEALLQTYAPSRGTVMDPFVGSGTSLVEAARIGLSATGADLNPAAVALARVYELVGLDPTDRLVVVDRVNDALAEAIGGSNGPLFGDTPCSSLCRKELESALVQLWREAESEPARLLIAALVVLCDFYQKQLDITKVFATWKRLEKTIRTLPDYAMPVIVYHADARALPVETDSMDLVVTSPPYLNVFNYHQKYRRSIEALDWDVLAVARSEIGSNRQNRGNRFLTVIQYSLDMALAIREAARATKPGGRLIFVLGRESVVRHTRFYNGELIAELAVHCAALSLTRRQERVFTNRYGTAIREDILHFSAPGRIPTKSDCIRTARSIARDVLQSTIAASLAPPQESEGLNDALKRLGDVNPSPFLCQPTTSLKGNSYRKNDLSHSTW